MGIRCAYDALRGVDHGSRSADRTTSKGAGLLTTHKRGQRRSDV